MRLIATIMALGIAGSAQAGLLFECTSAFNGCQSIAATLVSEAGPTDTYEVAVLGVTRTITLADDIWAGGGRYELAANTMDHTLDVNLWQGDRALWIGHGVYQGVVHSQNFGAWGTVPEPGTLAAIGAGLLGLLLARRRA